MRNLSTKLEDGVIWCDPSLVDLGQHREEWRDVSPVDADALNLAVIRYFERPWMQSNTLEWFILQGYLFDSMARLRRDAMHGSLFCITNWAYIFSKANADRKSVGLGKRVSGRVDFRGRRHLEKKKNK